MLEMRDRAVAQYASVQERFLQLTNPDEEFEGSMMYKLLNSLVGDEAQGELLKQYDPNVSSKDPEFMAMIDDKLRTLQVDVDTMKDK